MSSQPFSCASSLYICLIHTTIYQFPPNFAIWFLRTKGKNPEDSIPYPSRLSSSTFCNFANEFRWTVYEIYWGQVFSLTYPVIHQNLVSFPIDHDGLLAPENLTPRLDKPALLGCLSSEAVTPSTLNRPAVGSVTSCSSYTLLNNLRPHMANCVVADRVVRTWEIDAKSGHTWEFIAVDLSGGQQHGKVLMSVYTFRSTVG